MRADIKSLAVSFVRDETDRLTPADFETALDNAVLHYTGDKPRRKVADVVCAGGDTLPLPASWQSDSELLSAEYPIGDNPPSLLPCSIYTAPAGDQLRLGESLGSGAEVRLAFTVAHELTNLIDTIPLKHREAVACWAAAMLLEQLSAAAINDGDSTIQADSTDRRTKSQEYASRARAMKTRYGEVLESLASGGNTVAGTGTTVSWPSRGRLVRGIRRGY